MAYRIRSIKFNFLMNALLTGSSILFPLITFPIVSRALLSEAYGMVGFANATATWLSLIAMLGVGRYGIREIARVRDDAHQLAKTAREIFLVTLISTLVVYVCFIVSLFLVERFAADRMLFFVCGLAIVLNTFGVNWFFQGIEQYAYITVRGLVIKVVCLIGVILLVHVPGDYLIYAALLVVANGVANLVNFGYMLHILHEADREATGGPQSARRLSESDPRDLGSRSRSGQARPAEPLSRRAADAPQNECQLGEGDPRDLGSRSRSGQARPAEPLSRRAADAPQNARLDLRRHVRPLFTFFIIVAAISVYTALDTVMLGFLSTDAQTGFYTADIQIKNALVAVVSALSGVLLPRASNLLANGKQGEWRTIIQKAVKYVLLFSVPVCVLGAVLATPVMTWYAGEAFAGAGPALTVVVLAVIPIGLSVIFCDEVMVPLGMEKLCTYIYVTAAIADFVLNLFLIPPLGALGAALSTACVELLIAVVEFFIVRKHLWG